MKEINKSQDFGLTDLAIVSALGFVLLYTQFYPNEQTDITTSATPMVEVVNPYSGHVTYAITDTAKLIVPTSDALARPEDSMTEEGTIYFYRSLTDTEIVGKGMKMQ